MEHISKSQASTTIFLEGKQEKNLCVLGFRDKVLRKGPDLRNCETCIISYMKRVASLGSMHDTGCLGLVSGMTQRDDTGREEGRRVVQDGEHM